MTLVYLYAVAPARGSAWLRDNDLRGIADAPVRGVVAGAVVGAVSDVPASEFDQEPLDRNVADSAWLAPQAAAHQDVNARLLDGLAAVLPLSFGTLFRDEARVREMLSARATELASALAAVAGRAEWVLTLDRDRAAALAHVRRSAPPLGDASPGRAFLLKQQQEQGLRDQLRALDAEAVAALRDAAAPFADELTDEPLVHVEGGGPVGRMTALIDRKREGKLASALATFGHSWRARGYEVRQSGPWPAYRAAAKLGSLR